MAKIIAIDPTVPQTFVLPSQKKDPVDDQIKWGIRGLTAKEYAYASDKSFDRELVDDPEHPGDPDKRLYIPKINSQKKNLLLINLGLVEVENLEDMDGNQFKIEREENKVAGLFYPITEKCINMIPADVRNSLAGAISKLCEAPASVEEAKN